MMRQVQHHDSKSLYINVNGVQPHFGIVEFALVTGLLCNGNTSIKIQTDENRLVKRYFGSPTVTWYDLDSFWFVFRSSIDDDQSEHLSNQFFCTQEAKHDVCNEESPTNADLKKEIDGLKAHVDMKFNEILQAFTSLKNNLDVI
ncbi:hypothetical protein R3W88_004562 [Solanum pinnatisectum]|uniref:DUF1985 domain-containing protein n=1 Tax=Solanum pinnatisectum TaxID=50273 RepID=A0AAV9K9T0_9SOLN|nr:hypothetical protein R3W88_004562 [Solanum pinnatisectum]